MAESEEEPPPGGHADLAGAGSTASSTADLPARPRWPAIALLPLLPIALFALAARDPRWWGWLGLDHLHPYFADLVAILAAGQAKHAGLDVYQPNPLDPFGRPHVYGPWWLVTGNLGLTVADARWLGVLLGLAFLTTAAALLAPRRGASWMISVALIAGPPVLLALERANNDLVVFLLLVVVAILVASGRRGGMATGAICLITAAALKLYPVAALPALIQRRQRRLGLILAIVGAFASLVIAWHWRLDYRRALAMAPHPITIFAYGIPVEILTWRTVQDYRLWLVLGAAAAALFVAVPLFSRWRELVASVPVDTVASAGFVGGALSWITCYALTSNYPYRLVLLLLPAAIWLAQAGELPTRRVAWLQLAGTLALFWITVPKRWLGVAALAGDRTSAALLWMLVGFEQTLALVVTAALLAATLGWFGRVLAPASRTANQGAFD